MHSNKYKHDWYWFRNVVNCEEHHIKSPQIFPGCLTFMAQKAQKQKRPLYRYNIMYNYPEKNQLGVIYFCVFFP